MEKHNWISHVEWIVILVTIIGSFFALHSNINECNSRFDQFMIAWHEESKDFHTKLALQDQEFKFHMTQYHQEKAK